MKKNIVLTILLLSVLLTGALLSYGMAVNIPQYLQKEKDTNLSARMLFVNSDDLIWDNGELDALTERDDVLFVFSQEEYLFSSPMQIDMNESAWLYVTGAVNHMLPHDILAGKTKNLEKFELMIPSEIVMEDGTVIQGENFLGQTVSVDIDVPTYLTKEEAENRNPSKKEPHTVCLTIAGVYDETSGVYLDKQCFATIDTVKYLNALCSGNRYDLVEPNTTVRVLTWDYETAIQLETQLNAEGYTADLGIWFNYRTIVTGVFISATLFIAFMIAGLFALYMMIKQTTCRKESLLELTDDMEKRLLMTATKQYLGILFAAMLVALLGCRWIYPFISKMIFENLYMPIFSKYFWLGAGGVLLIHIFVMIMLLKSIQSGWLKAKVAYHHKMIQQQKEYHNNLAIYHQRVRQLHHDMNNHFLILYNALKQENADQAVQYIEKHLNLLSQSKMTYTGYLLLDTVLDYKKQIADAQRTEFLVRVQIPSDLQLAESLQNDLAMMMASYIDNALEAAAKISDEANRWIKITLKHDERYLYCKIENSAAEEVAIKEGELPESTKTDDVYHGMGLKHVKQLAETHGGCLMLACAENVFTASFMVRYEFSVAG